MRELKQGLSMPGVKRWQGFLKDASRAGKSYYDGPINGTFDRRLAAATKQFQRDQRGQKLKVNGIVDEETMKVALGRGYKPEPQFSMGPDYVNDLRKCRPYFLIPLPEPPPETLHAPTEDQAAERKMVAQRIGAYVEAMKPLANGGPVVTDLYIFSHGWHRNFYSAVSAYDRLISRYSRLLHAGRFDPDPQQDGYQPSTGKGFRPLFVNLHWHSDPGEDEFVDKSGRRDKQSFLRAVNTVFQAGEPRDSALLVNDFEDIFEYFSALAAPDTNALESEFDEKAVELIKRLDRYEFANEPPTAKVDPSLVVARRAEKAAAAWTCYHEADTRRVLLDQDEKARPFFTPWQALMALSAFIARIGVLFGLLTYLFGLLKPLVNLVIGKLWQPIAKGIITLAHLPFHAAKLVCWQSELIALILFVPVIFIACVCGIIYLRIRAGTRASHPFAPGKNFPLLALISWAPLQILCAVPAVLYLTFTFFIGRRRGHPHDLFDERFGERDHLADPKRLPWIRDWLTGLLRWPLVMLRNAIRPDASVNSMIDTIDAQAAFYEMQKKGVETGIVAAKFMAKLFGEVEALRDDHMRIHLIGHSFGGLVVANLARTLALGRQGKSSLRQDFGTAPGSNGTAWKQETIGHLDTLCLVQGAIASDWFKGEPTLAAFIRGTIACIYSLYDTANGFLYPVANGSRLAAGYVGLTSVGGTGSSGQTPACRARFVLLVRPPKLNDEAYVRPPDLNDKAYKPDEDCGKKSLPSKSCNLDASRIIYQGAPATGGGHDDIFKDDVIHLIWAAIRIPFIEPEHETASIAAPRADPLPVVTAKTSSRLEREEAMILRQIYTKDPALSAVARQYKDELLLRTFGATAQTAGLSSNLAVIPMGHNVVGVGYGTKVTAGASVQGQIAVRVYVRSKLPRAALSAADMVPTDVNGTPTDVIAVGDLRALRPVSCGVSIGHFRVTAGTLGCLVVKNDAPTGTQYILSNSHVLTDSNVAAIGDPILEPGKIDGGNPANPIAKLTDFQLIDFVNANRIDAAIAEVLHSGDVKPDILDIGRIVNPPMVAALYQSVRKHGRTTQHTVGVITDLSADVRVRYGMQTAEFEDQLSITGAGGAFSDGGDSGSLIVDAVTLRPVALLFAGGGATTFANPIELVLDHFNVTAL